MCPRAEYLYACDEKWWRHHWQSVKDFQGEKWTQVHNSQTEKFAREFGLHWKPGKGSRGLGRDAIHHGSNSGYQAINLAYLLGATRIILLGYNMSRVNGKAHFFGSHPSSLCDGAYENYVSQFTSLANDLEREGVEVINCTENSALTQFKRGSLCELLSSAQAQA